MKYKNRCLYISFSNRMPHILPRVHVPTRRRKTTNNDELRRTQLVQRKGRLCRGGCADRTTRTTRHERHSMELSQVYLTTYTHSRTIPTKLYWEEAPSSSPWALINRVYLLSKRVTENWDKNIIKRAVKRASRGRKYTYGRSCACVFVLYMIRNRERQREREREREREKGAPSPL